MPKHRAFKVGFKDNYEFINKHLKVYLVVGEV